MTTKYAKSSFWNISLWIAQILLAGMFLMAGFMKTVTPIATLAATIPLAGEMPGLIRFIGVSELAGGLGLLLPAALRILPQLTILSAAALGLVMVLATGFHIARAESAATTVALAIIAAFIAWGRLFKAPIESRAPRTTAVAKT